MLAAAGAANRNVSPDLKDRLPVCASGLTPSDWLIVAVWSDARRSRQPFAVAASRPSIARALMATFDGATALNDNVSIGSGTLVTLRCRTTISPHYQRPPAELDPLDRWLPDHGIYLRLDELAGPDQITPVATEIDQLEKAFGPQSMALLAPRMDLISMLVAQQLTSGGIVPGRIRDLRSQLASDFQRFKVPFAEAFALDPTETNRQTYLDVFEKRLISLPADNAYELFAEASSGDESRLSDKEKIRFGEILFPRLVTSADQNRRNALMLRLAELTRDADPAAAKRLVHDASVPPASCASADIPARLESQTLDDNDYPPSAIAQGITGVTVNELSIDSKGGIRDRRVILSAPSDIFDNVAADRFFQFRYAAARKNGRPFACTGIVQPIRWKLPDIMEPSFPDLEEDVPSMPTI
jgi:hypothetical protein